MKSIIVLPLVCCFALTVLLCGCKEVPREYCDNVAHVVDLPFRTAPLKYSATNIKDGVTLDFRGTIIAVDAKSCEHKAGILLIQFFDREDKVCKSNDLGFSSMFKCGYRYLAAGPEPRQFMYKVKIPETAVRAEIRVATLLPAWHLQMSGFKYETIMP